MKFFTALFKTEGMEHIRLFLLFLFIGMLGGKALFFCQEVKARVASLPHFVVPGEFAIGVDGEMGFANRGSLGLQFAYKQGHSDLVNFFVELGLGGLSGDMKLGGGALLDVFPDVQGQLGLGVALRTHLAQFQDRKNWVMEMIPYLHKTLVSEQLTVEPFVGLPLSTRLAGQQAPYGASLALGSLFEHSPQFRSSFELGIPLNPTAYTGLTLGVTYFH